MNLLTFRTRNPHLETAEKVLVTLERCTWELPRQVMPTPSPNTHTGLLVVGVLMLLAASYLATLILL